MFFGQVSQDMKQNHRIDSAGNSDNYPLAVSQKSMFRKVLFHLRDEIGHGAMLSGETLRARLLPSIQTRRSGTVRAYFSSVGWLKITKKNHANGKIYFARRKNFDGGCLSPLD